MTNKYVQTTLTMPENMPLFNYNLNFHGLRNLMQQINIQTNSNTEQIESIKEELATKLPEKKFQNIEQILNHSIKIGINCEKTFKHLQSYTERNNRKQDFQMSNIENYTDKMGKLNRVLEYVLNLAEQNKTKINNDDSKHQKNIDQSFRRIDERVNSSIQSMNKTLNLYFTQTNKKLSSIQTDVNSNKRQTSATIETIKNSMNQKISQIQLKSAMDGLGQQIKSSILGDLNSDHMKRLAMLNEYSNKLQQNMNETQLKIKSAKQTVKQLSDKLSKSLSVQTFEVEKHKIYEKLSEYKSKIDDLSKKNQQFVDFRKLFYEMNEKTRHTFMEIEDRIKKLGEKGSNFKKMEDIGNILESLDPHLICQVGNEVKLHQKQLGKLQKQVAYLENELQSARNNSVKMPEVNNGQTSDAIMKIIKEYMTNLDFQGRLKRAQKQLHDLSKKSDGINQLQKKIYMLSKDIDIGALMKQIKRKSDEEATKKDFKIMDSKIEKLFDFYKQVRRQIEDLYKKSTRFSKQSIDNASLTTKRLYAANCISCTTRNRPNSTRNYSKSKVEISLDESIDGLKNSKYLKVNNS